MATNLDDSFPGLPDNFINCPICRKRLTVPKCLPCLHSFCLKCLNTHIIVSQRGENSFPCPVCQEPTLAPEIGLRPDEWAKHFKSNTLVDSVIDAVDLKPGNRKCDPCKSTKRQAFALTWCTSCREALCSTCTNSHRGMKLTRNHKLIELAKIRSQPVAAIIENEKCPDHDNQFLQYYCKDHKQQCCPTCAIAVHRKCDEVSEMEKLGKDIRRQQKGEKLLKRLNACLETQQDFLAKTVFAKDSLSQKKQAILKEIHDLKTKLIELLDNMEASFSNEFRLLHETRETELRDAIRDGQRIANAISDTTSMLEAAIIHGSDSQLFITYENVKQECQRFEKLIVSSNKEQKEVEYKFHMDERIKSFANSVRKFGHLTMESEKSASFRDGSVRETGIFSARSPFDDLRAVDIFSDGDILIADRMSKSVVLFSASGEYVSHTNFKMRPWGVAAIGLRTACVSLPEVQEIHILKSANKTLEDFRTIPTTVSCFALTDFSGEYLAIQHREEREERGRVQIVQSDKQQTHKLAIDVTANHENVQGIAYDAATSKLFIATDFDSIECYNINGRLLFRNTYKGDGDFHGMCVDRQSNVYVTSNAGKGVLQLTHEGERIRMIPTSPLAPLDVAISPKGNQMVVVGRSDLVYIYTFR